MTFDESKFNWKKAIWDLNGRVEKLEERVNNELRHMSRFVKYVIGSLAFPIIVGLTILFIKYIFT